jgi:hypothetical protein
MLPESSISAVMLVFNGKLGLVGDSVFQGIRKLESLLFL